jgi:hypothetical protein
MVNHPSNSVCHGNDGLLLSDPFGESSLLLSQGGVFPSRCGMSGFDKSRSQPRTSLAGFPTSALARTYLTAGTHSSPGGKMTSTGKEAQIDPNLCSDDCGYPSIDAWSQIQTCERLGISLSPWL